MDSYIIYIPRHILEVFQVVRRLRVSSDYCEGFKGILEILGSSWLFCWLRDINFDYFRSFKGILIIFVSFKGETLKVGWLIWIIVSFFFSWPRGIEAWVLNVSVRNIKMCQLSEIYKSLNNNSYLNELYIDRWILIIKHLMVICEPPNHIHTLLILPPRLFPILFFGHFILLHGKASSDDAKQACTKIFLERALSNHMHFLFLFLFATDRGSTHFQSCIGLESIQIFRHAKVV